jgi:acetyl esterase/lipase
VADLDEARGRFEAIQAECDRDDLRHTVITQPSDSMTKAQLTQLCQDNNAFAADIQAALGIVWEHAAAGLGALAGDQPGPPPEPPPAEQWNGPAAGFYGSQHYGSGARAWGNLTIPHGIPRGALFQVHGGGWMMGDPYQAGPLVDAVVVDDYVPLLEGQYGLSEGHRYGLQVMASYAAQRWGVIVWEPAYSYSSGDPDVCLRDVTAAVTWLRQQLAAWGVPSLPIVYAGHSAGGQLSLRAALDPALPAPAAWLGMAAAGLTVHRTADVQDAPGGFGQGGTGWIFQTAWGNPANWPSYAPDTHLHDRGERFPLYVEQGNQNGRDDGSVLVRWAANFTPLAVGAGWPTQYHEQSGANHFAIRFDQSPTTRADMDKIWSEV